MAQSFSTTVTDWQGVDDEPTAGSDNLVKSGGAFSQINNIIPNIQSLETVVGLANTNGVWYVDGDTFISWLIPARGNVDYKIELNQDTNFCFIPSSGKEELVGGHNIPFCNGTNVIVSSFISGKTPSDCGYIVMLRKSAENIINLTVDNYNYVEVKIELLRQINKTAEHTIQAQIGKNLLDLDKITIGCTFNSDGSIWELPSSSLAITDFIPVNNNSLISNFSIVEGTRCAVYDKFSVFRRTFSSSLYTYQEGDAYVRYTIDTNISNMMIEYGTVSTDYVPYTKAQEVINVSKYYFAKIKRCLQANYSNDYQFFRFLASPGIQRKYGVDSTENELGMLYITFDESLSNKVEGSFKIVITVYSSSSNIFNYYPGLIVTQKGSGVYELTANITKSLNNELSVYFCIPSGGEKARVADIKMYAIDVDSANSLQEYINKSTHKDDIVLDCWNEFDSTTEGWGVSRFSSMIDATSFLQSSGNPNMYYKAVIRCMPGIYDEFEERWAGDTDIQNYLGIVPFYNSLYTSFDVDDPSITQLKWDGHYGFPLDYTMTLEECQARCIFHISTRANSKTEINGFYINTKNTRYCIHPESASFGYGNIWLIKNCILHSEGRPQGVGEEACVGIGLCVGEKGSIENCRFENSDPYFIAGHNNPSSTSSLFLKGGGELVIKNSNANNLDFAMQSLTNDVNTPFKIIFDGCGNIDTVHTYPIGEGIVNNFKIANICSEIGTINEE